MNIFIWILQVVLALVFAAAGSQKVMQPQETESISPGLARFIGTAEILGAIGLIVPWVTGIAPVLTPLAAVGLAIVAALASGFHFRREEYKNIGVTVFLLILAVLLAYFRF